MTLVRSASSASDLHPGRLVVGIAGVLALVVACRAPGLGLGAPDLAGCVRFPATRSIQSTLSELADGATVSLIDATTNRTAGSTVTDEGGHFHLSLGDGFSPEPGVFYYLEAVKGLGGNMPGHVAARVRTLATYDNGWHTLTNTDDRSPIVVDFATTALAVGTALRLAASGSVDLRGLMGSLAPQPDGPRYTEQDGLSTSDYEALLSIVGDRLSHDADPIAGVTLVPPGSWTALEGGDGLTVAGTSPAHARPGDTVTITGGGFDPAPGMTRVYFDGEPAQVLSAAPGQLTVVVPRGAGNGPVSVEVGDLTVHGPAFQVDGSLAGLIRATGVPTLAGRIR